jgi:hypothetical protein
MLSADHISGMNGRTPARGAAVYGAFAPGRPGQTPGDSLHPIRSRYRSNRPIRVPDHTHKSMDMLCKSRALAARSRRDRSPHKFVYGDSRFPKFPNR